MSRIPTENEVIIEQQVIGNYAKVTAICMRTHVEATIVGDAKTPSEHLTNLAMQKLRYVLGKKQ